MRRVVSFSVVVSDHRVAGGLDSDTEAALYDASPMMQPGNGPQREACCVAQNLLRAAIPRSSA